MCMAMHNIKQGVHKVLGVQFCSALSNLRAVKRSSHILTLRP